MERCCPDPPLIAFCRPRNLRNCIIRAKVSTRDTPEPVPTTCRPCIRKGRKCELCHVLPEQSSITSSSTSKIHRLRLQSPADCDSQFVVYAITCILCPSVNQYVGQTSKFRKRMNNHKSSIRLEKDDERDCALLYTHFKRPDHSPNTLQFTILEKCQDKHSLEIAETHGCGS
jgi:hypothetical protein